VTATLVTPFTLGPRPSTVPLIQRLLDRGWSRRQICRAIEVGVHRLSQRDETGTADTHRLRLTALLHVATPTHRTAELWVENAACAGEQTDDWFTDELDRETAARKVCEGCQVRWHCLGTAIANDMVGMWGGRTDLERAAPKPVVERCGQGHMMHRSPDSDELLCRACLAAVRTAPRGTA